LKFADMPSGLAALSKMMLAVGLQSFFFCGALERGCFKQDESQAPGDFKKFGNLGVPYSKGIQDTNARKHGLNSLLTNGHLAGVVIMGIMFQNGAGGTTGPHMWLLGGAFEKETGVQASLTPWASARTATRMPSTGAGSQS